jgi:hypothetical protein
MALVRERTIPTERPPLVSKISTNFFRLDVFLCLGQQIPTAEF